MGSCIKVQTRIPQRSSPLRIIFLLPLAFSLISTLYPFHFLAQGRQISRQPPDPNLRKTDNERGAEKMRALVMGSSPPRCDQTRCKNCGQCEAVQVPISPTDQQQQPLDYVVTEYARGDDISSYKPMCWKCKCGNFIINP